MSEPSGSRLDASTVASVVNGVINVLGLQPSQISGATSTAATVTQTRRATRLVCSLAWQPDHISVFYWWQK